MMAALPRRSWTGSPARPASASREADRALCENALHAVGAREPGASFAVGESMEGHMTDASVEQWEKELRVLLEHIRTHPSAATTQERERVVVLEKLIESRSLHARE